MQSFIRKSRVTSAAPSYNVADDLSALHAAGRGANMVGSGYAFWAQDHRSRSGLGAPKFGMELDYASGAWLEFLGEYVQDLCAPDPVYQATRERVMPVWWGADLKSGDPLCNEFGFCKEQLDAFHLCYERTGIRSGMAVPVRGPRRGGGYIGFLSDRPIDDFVPNRSAVEAKLLPVALKYFDHVSLRLDPEVEGPQLSNRERECLTLVAHGQTMTEIAKHLTIASSTVRYHIENAVEKLDVSSRSEAIAKAVAGGLIAYSKAPHRQDALELAH